MTDDTKTEMRNLIIQAFGARADTRNHCLTRAKMDTYIEGILDEQGGDYGADKYNLVTAILQEMCDVQVKKGSRAKKNDDPKAQNWKLKPMVE